MYKIIKILTIPFLSFLAFVSLLCVDVVIENIAVDNQIRNFVENGVFKYSVGNFYIYEVEIEEELNHKSVTFDESGFPDSTNPGDIFIQKESKIDVVDYSAAFISYFFGGHAGMIIDQNLTIEVNGAMSNPALNIVDICYNDVFYSSDKRDVLGIRVKASDEEINKAVDFAYESLDSPYNFSFVFNRKNSFYCTDLLSRAYGKEAGLDFNLDKDGIATSCNDLVLSEDTYIIYYMYYIGSEKHLYYAV